MSTCSGDQPGVDTLLSYQTLFATAESRKLPELVHAPNGSRENGDRDSRLAVAATSGILLHPTSTTPRRLVYWLPDAGTCLSRPATKRWKWLRNLELPEKVKVHVLMGGEDVEEWDLDPEKPAILIGTQDMLLSRALNRGYGMGRFRWPMHYGLLNNDCLWILDEIRS